MLAATFTFINAAPAPISSHNVSARAMSDVSGGYCWTWCDPEHSTQKWWEDCKCHAGWEGDCCDIPVTCTAEHQKMCPFSKMQEKTAQCASISGAGPITVGTAAMGLPPVLQGVFWLTEQGDSSALMSFGTSNDGAGLSKLDLTQSDYQFRIRVGGDKVWSFHDKAKSWGLVEAADLIYNFRMEGADGNPAQSIDEIVGAQIIPSGRNLGHLALTATWLLDFRAELKPAGTHEQYASSVVWERPSKVLGVAGGYYDLVQVMDGEGNKLQPAFDDWVRYCGTAETGETPGAIWYREAQ